MAGSWCQLKDAFVYYYARFWQTFTTIDRMKKYEKDVWMVMVMYVQFYIRYKLHQPISTPSLWVDAVRSQFLPRKTHQPIMPVTSELLIGCSPDRTFWFVRATRKRSKATNCFAVWQNAQKQTAARHEKANNNNSNSNRSWNGERAKQDRCVKCVSECALNRTISRPVHVWY